MIASAQFGKTIGISRILCSIITSGTPLTPLSILIGPMGTGVTWRFRCQPADLLEIILLCRPDCDLQIGTIPVICVDYILVYLLIVA
jgi:hypothetical protein